MLNIQFSSQPHTLIAAEKKCLFCVHKLDMIVGMKTKTRLYHGDLETLLKVRVSPAFLASLDAYALRHGWSRSDAVRKILTRHLFDSASPVHYRPSGRFSSPTRLRDALEQSAIINPHCEDAQ